MRTLIALSALGVSAALSACATRGEPTGYAADLRRLEADCRARDGVLVPLPGASTGRAETEHACQIRGASRVNR